MGRGHRTPQLLPAHSDDVHCTRGCDGMQRGGPGYGPAGWLAAGPAARWGRADDLDAKVERLMAYSVNLAEENRRGAGYVNRVLRGANPAEPPVEPPHEV